MKTVNRRFATTLPMDKMMIAVMQSMHRVGGAIQQTSPNSFRIQNGNINVQFAFTANITADVTVQPIQGGYDVTIFINTSPSAIFWVCLIVGFFVLGILWLVCIFYFFVDPTSQYFAALDSVQYQLDFPEEAKPMPSISAG